MELKLKILQGKSAGQELTVAGPKFIIGRGSGCHLQPRSELVAERHCIIELEPGRATIQDLGSSTGTFLGGERISAPRDLRPGDRLRIGPLEFEVLLKVGLASKKKPKVTDSREAASRLATNNRRDLDVSQWLDDQAEGESEPRADVPDLSRDANPAPLANAAPPPRAPTHPGSPPPPGAPDTTQLAAEALKKFYRK